MSKMKKVILFIVEGLSDQNALEPIVDALIDDSQIMFEVVRGDSSIGLSNSIVFSSKNIKNRITDIIKHFLLNNRGIKKDYIEKVIYIVDTDGCFINESFIFDSPKDKTIRYEDDGIYTQDVDFIKKRNHEKSTNLSIISSIDKEIYGLPIETYYFSCNLDHVLHDIRNLEQSLKEAYADDFAERFIGREQEFITFLKENNITLGDEYLMSWSKIKEGLNSLLRFTNFNVFFTQNIQYFREETKLILNS